MAQKTSAQVLLAIMAALLWCPGCLFPNSVGTTDVRGPSALAASATRCFNIEPKASQPETIAPDGWLVTIQRLSPDGAIVQPIVGFGQTDKSGVAHICTGPDQASDALLVSAKHSDAPNTLTHYLSGGVQEGTFVLDALSTHITTILFDIHQLPFSGSITRVTMGDFANAENSLRTSENVGKHMVVAEFSLETARKAWVNAGSLASVGAQSACLNAPVNARTFSLAEGFTFADAHPENFSPRCASSIAPDGSLSSVAGQAIQNTSLTINNLNLFGRPFDVMQKLAGELSGAFLSSHAFDTRGDMDASLTWVQLHNGSNSSALLPCVAGILTIENTGAGKAIVEAGSAMCFAIEGTKPFFVPADQFVVFGDEDRATSFVLGLPGIHNGLQDDGVQIATSAREACVRFSRGHELAASGEMGDMASVLLTMCHVTSGFEAVTSSRMREASRLAFETGLWPQTAIANLSRNDVAAQIGRADFVNNPAVMNFLKADVRDSLINYNQGYKANLFVTGKGFDQSYDLLLNGAGEPIARITTGPQGQYSGGVNVKSAKVGDFIRFVAPGRHFDVRIEANCAGGG